MAVQTGDMTKMVRNRASPSKIWFGGIWATPIALRAKDSTMAMRMNEVIIIRMAGTRLSTVSSSRSCTPRVSVSPCPEPICTWTDGRVWLLPLQPVSRSVSRAIDPSGPVARTERASLVSGPQRRDGYLVVIFESVRAERFTTTILRPAAEIRAGATGPDARDVRPAPRGYVGTDGRDLRSGGPSTPCLPAVRAWPEWASGSLCRSAGFERVRGGGRTRLRWRPLRASEGTSLGVRRGRLAEAVVELRQAGGRAGGQAELRLRGRTM